MTKTNLTAAIDAFGELKAKIAELKLQEDALKASFADLDVGNYEGELFRLNVTAPETKKQSDELKAEVKQVVADFLDSLTCQYRTAHITKVRTPTYTVRARTGTKVVAG